LHALKSAEYQQYYKVPKVQLVQMLFNHFFGIHDQQRKFNCYAKQVVKLFQDDCLSLQKTSMFHL